VAAILTHQLASRKISVNVLLSVQQVVPILTDHLMALLSSVQELSWRIRYWREHCTVHGAISLQYLSPIQQVVAILTDPLMAKTAVHSACAVSLSRVHQVADIVTYQLKRRKQYNCKSPAQHVVVILSGQLMGMKLWNQTVVSPAGWRPSWGISWRGEKCAIRLSSGPSHYSISAQDPYYCHRYLFHSNVIL
jgi:hypothetical protein